MRQLVLEKENSEFKPVKLHLKIDLVPYPARADGVGKYDWQMLISYLIPCKTPFLPSHIIIITADATAAAAAAAATEHLLLLKVAVVAEVAVTPPTTLDTRGMFAKSIIIINIVIIIIIIQSPCVYSSDIMKKWHKNCNKGSNKKEKILQNYSGKSFF